jgi:diacylglycerol O-acyltransferase / wax synthase
MGDRMTALDAAFYHLERTGQLLHVGGIYTAEGALDYDRTLADLSARLHLIPRYTQRVVPVPLNLGHPTWEPARGFDIRMHVVRHTLRRPGDDEQLRSLASRLFAEPLARSRPLWELHQIDGYGGERSVLFAKVHHCMIDGVSGVQLLNVLFDVSPKPPAVAPPLDPGAVPPLPSAVAQLVRGLLDSFRDGLARVRGALELVRNPGRGLVELRRAGDAIAELGRILLEGAPATPFNGPVGTLRRAVWTTLSLGEVKAIKDRLGGTVNDVVLATISSALRGYLEGRGVNPDRIELRAMVPVNVRAANEHLKLGNRVSMMVAPLPVGILDPRERLRQVRTAMALLKERGQATRVTRMVDLMDLLPPALLTPLGWLQVKAAPINTVCTNLPGPPVSIYVQGQRLETLVPIVPLAQGVGLGFAILSYADALTIGITADSVLVPDVDRFCELLQAGLAELRMSAGIAPARRSTPVHPERKRRASLSPVRVA